MNTSSSGSSTTGTSSPASSGGASQGESNGRSGFSHNAFTLSGLLIVRIVLAGLFLFSGLAKLDVLGTYGNTPKEFATAIHKFKLLDYSLIAEAAFVIPWLEVVCGAALLFGLAARGAAYVANILLIAFSGGLILAIFRDLDIENCTCFGGRLAEQFGLIGAVLEPPVGWSSVIRNVILLGLGVLVMLGGAGYLSIDRLLGRKRG